jgi:hypothetical protein
MEKDEKAMKFKLFLAWDHIFMLKNQLPFNGDEWIEAPFLVVFKEKHQFIVGRAM